MNDLADWWLGEKDDFLYLAKGFVVVSISMLVVLTIPVWILPYVVYKAIKHGQ
jgi:hypothetical protein